MNKVCRYGAETRGLGVSGMHEATHSAWVKLRSFRWISWGGIMYVRCHPAVGCCLHSRNSREKYIEGTRPLYGPCHH